ncbi:hypothetical protein YC2023_010941 [Brassica napus]
MIQPNRDNQMKRLKRLRDFSERIKRETQNSIRLINERVYNIYRVGIHRNVQIREGEGKPPYSLKGYKNDVVLDLVFTILVMVSDWLKESGKRSLDGSDCPCLKWMDKMEPCGVPWSKGALPFDQLLSS